MNFVALYLLISLSFVFCSEVVDDKTQVNSDVQDVIEPEKTFQFIDDPVRNSESTTFLVWYMIPEEVRRELVYYYFMFTPSDSIIRCQRPPGVVYLSPTRYRYTTPEEILENVKTDRDWYTLSDEYLINAATHSEYTQLNFLVEAIKNASPSTIEEIFQRRPQSLILLKKIQSRASEELVDFVLASRTSASEIIEIFRILERYSDLDLAQLSYIEKIREVAFERDDCELLMFTNAYPDIIRPVSACQGDLMNSLASDRIPKVWSLICDNPHPKLAQNRMYRSDLFVKFRLFSEPVNRNKWTLDMLAVASQEYETALKLPLSICKKGIYSCSDITESIRNISQMIPLIPDPVYRQKFIEKYNFTGMNHTKYVTQFEHLNKEGKKSTVKVIPFCEQTECVVKCVAPVRIADTNSLVSKVLGEKK